MKIHYLMLTVISLAACQKNGVEAAAEQTKADSDSSALSAEAPATKLEAFKPKAGTIATIAYNDLGGIDGVRIDAREVKADSLSVRGVIVDIRESQYTRGQSFIDADEVPELVKGIDALLAIQKNPTSFKNFEVHYTTRGDFKVVAFNDNRGAIQYSVTAGRVSSAQRFLQSADELKKLRAIFVEASRQLATPAT